MTAKYQWLAVREQCKRDKSSYDLEVGESQEVWADGPWRIEEVGGMQKGHTSYVLWFGTSAIYHSRNMAECISHINEDGELYLRPCDDREDPCGILNTTKGMAHMNNAANVAYPECPEDDVYHLNSNAQEALKEALAWEQRGNMGFAQQCLLEASVWEAKANMAEAFRRMRKAMGGANRGEW